MITSQIESFTEQLPELKQLLPLHYQELALNQDTIPLDPQYDIYESRESLGELLYVTLRENGGLIGYYIGFVSPGLHYRTCLTCITDIFYIHKDHRGKKSGLLLFQTVENELKRRGVNRWFTGSKCHLDASGFFELLGFERVEIYYSKMI